MTAARTLTNDPVIEAARAAASDRVRAEIANGALLMAPAPRSSHQHAQLRLVAQLDGALRFRRGESGPPTGWRFLLTPELHLGVGPDKLNPDIAGWRAQRAPTLDEYPITTAPDWVCEVLSPSTEATDRAIKLPLFASYGVSHAWLVDPDARVIEVYENVRGAFVQRARAEGDIVAAPFDATTVAFDALWE
ncbi:MAG: Uma2 family endonuclease [Myxococcales bacterium]|nr:Uma2 family endonuclease [Myxococcales bacterium]